MNKRDSLVALDAIEALQSRITALESANAEAQSRAVKMMKRALSPEDFKDLTFILGRLARR